MSLQIALLESLLTGYTNDSLQIYSLHLPRISQRRDEHQVLE